MYDKMIYKNVSIVTKVCGHVTGI